MLISLPQIYKEFYHTINYADHQKDLKWWSNNHGVNMAMNWPAFMVNLAKALNIMPLFHFLIFVIYQICNCRNIQRNFGI